MKQRFATLLLLLSLLLPGFGSASQNQTESVSLAVRGMFCGSCAAAVKKALAPIPGILDVAVEVQKDRVTVTYDPRKSSVPQMVEAIRKAGYRAEAPAAP